MVTTAPKNSRNKRLHIVFFTDASKTKSTSVSLRNLAIFGCLTLSFFTAAGMSIYLYRQNKNVISARDEYIRELKSAITSYAVTNDKNEIMMTNEADPQTDLARKIAKEIQFPAASETKSAAIAPENTLAILQSSRSSLSTVSANLARNDKSDSKGQATTVAKNSADSRANSASGGSDKQVVQVSASAESMAASDSSNSGSSSQRGSLTGVQVEHKHASEVNGQTTIHFQLVNTSRSRGQSWTGRVCGVAELSANSASAEANRNSVALAARGQVAGYIALPGGFRVDSAKAPNNACADGELVRFSRLRPTELVVPAKQDAIKRVTIFFVESGSNRVLTQPIEF